MKATFVIVFYLLVQSPPEHISRQPNVTFSAYPKWERVEFPYHSFGDESLCRQMIGMAHPPSNVASIVVCERQR